MVTLSVSEGANQPTSNIPETCHAQQINYLRFLLKVNVNKLYHPQINHQIIFLEILLLMDYMQSINTFL